MLKKRKKNTRESGFPKFGCLGKYEGNFLLRESNKENMIVFSHLLSLKNSEENKLENVRKK